jgi:hypothetical protein
MATELALPLGAGATDAIEKDRLMVRFVEQVTQWIKVLQSDRLVSDARTDAVAKATKAKAMGAGAHVDAHVDADVDADVGANHVKTILDVTKAKAKPVLRALYGMVGEAGRAEFKLEQSADFYLRLGFQKHHQNKVRFVWFGDSLGKIPFFRIFECVRVH